MRQRFVMPLLGLVALTAVALVSCSGSGPEPDRTGPTAIPIGELVTPSPTRMTEQVMNTPAPEQVMATPTEQVMATLTDTPVVETSPTPAPTEPPPTPTETLEPTKTPAAEPQESPTPEVTAEPIVEPSPEPTPAPTPEPVTHTVQPGENLFRIGLQYGIDWQEITIANNLPANHRIQVGQVLTIPVEPGEEPEPVQDTVHVVRPGETLFRIGLQYKMAWDAIARANQIANPNTIYVGQELIIPSTDASEGQTTQPPAEPAAEETSTVPITHIVQPGETLFRIGLLYGQSWQVIAEVNGITNPNHITVGLVLTIPAP